MTKAVSNRGEMNKLLPEDRSAHEWYRFVLSFPPHLVRTYLQRFAVTPAHRVLDPFCGTGTTLVECKKQGIPSIGVEANPMAHLASTVKVDWSLDPEALVAHAQEVAHEALLALKSQGFADDDSPLFRGANRAAEIAKRHALRTLPREAFKLLLTDSISPLPLHKALVLLETLNQQRVERYHRHELLAFAKALVFSISNLHFGPEVGVCPPKTDAAVVGPWLTEVQKMANDLRQLANRFPVSTSVHCVDARRLSDSFPPASIDAVITSPPYPNEKDYTRTTRLESVLLGLIRNKSDLRTLKKQLVRSNTRGVYKGDSDDLLVSRNREIQRIAKCIEARRIELGKTSGFERMYARVTKLYFGGMVRHLDALRRLLRPGAYLAYVVGDQASYLRVMIRTGQVLAQIAQSLGYELVGIDLFRTRLATATREMLREEVVILRWPGTNGAAHSNSKGTEWTDE